MVPTKVKVDILDCSVKMDIMALQQEVEGGGSAGVR